jgi:hypothetical protein
MGRERSFLLWKLTIRKEKARNCPRLFGVEKKPWVLSTPSIIQFEWEGKISMNKKLATEISIAINFMTSKSLSSSLRTCTITKAWMTVISVLVM